MNNINLRAKSLKTINEFLDYASMRSGADGIVILSEGARYLPTLQNIDKPMYVIGDHLSPIAKRLSRRTLPNAPLIENSKLTKGFLENKILVYLGNPSNSSTVLHYLREYKDQALLTVIASPAKTSVQDCQNEWDKREIQFAFHGQAASKHLDNKDLFVGISGILATPKKPHKSQNVSVLAIVTQYNEADIVLPVIKHLKHEGVDVHVVDNWSSDGSYELIKEYASHTKGVTIERFPAKDTGVFDFVEILKHNAEFAKKSEYDWIMRNDADELRYSPWDNLTLQEAVSFVDSLGYNAIDFTVFDFKATRDGYDIGHDPKKFFTHGEFGNRSGHFVQVKLWKNNPDADLEKTGGHHVLFPNQRIFPLKFLLCHYSLRSEKQAREKIFKNRLPRFSATGRKRGWHTHYDHMKETESSIVQSDHGLILYNDPVFKEKHLLERLSGVGIRRVDRR